jgi:hypothetical protein
MRSGHSRPKESPVFKAVFRFRLDDQARAADELHLEISNLSRRRRAANHAPSADRVKNR